MAPKKNRRFLLFVPEGEEGGTLQTAALAAHKGLEAITMGPVPADPAGREARARALGETLRAAPRKGFVIVDPPQRVEDLAWLDEVCRATFGKRAKNLPVAVFFTPRPARKKKPVARGNRKVTDLRMIGQERERGAVLKFSLRPIDREAQVRTIIEDFYRRRAIVVADLRARLEKL